MMEKLAQPGEVGGVGPPTITYKVVVYVRSSWEGRYTTLSLFLLYLYMYSVERNVVTN